MTSEAVESGRPSLRSAKVRASRAAQRLAELESLEAQLAAMPSQVKITADRATWERREPLSPEFSLANSPTRGAIASEAKLLSGEVLYHLRTALDYVAYNLAWLDSGERPSGNSRTQFPIQDQPTRWSKVARSSLPGVSHGHRELVREYQPFSGCEWTKTLRDLSNADKHNFVIDLYSEFVSNLTLSPDSVSIDPDDPTRVVIATEHPSSSFGLPDGRPLLPILLGATEGVARLLMRLQGAFGEHDELTLRENPTT